METNLQGDASYTITIRHALAIKGLHSLVQAVYNSSEVASNDDCDGDLDNTSCSLVEVTLGVLTDVMQAINDQNLIQTTTK